MTTVFLSVESILEKTDFLGLMRCISLLFIAMFIMRRDEFSDALNAICTHQRPMYTPVSKLSFSVRDGKFPYAQPLISPS